MVDGHLLNKWGPQIQLENAIKQFQQDGKANARNSGVIAAFREFIADKRMLGAGNFIKWKGGIGVAQGGPDNVAARGRHVGVEGAENEEPLGAGGELAGADAVEGVVRRGPGGAAGGLGGCRCGGVHHGAKRAGVDVGAKETDIRLNVLVEGGAQRQVAAQAHARGANAAAGLEVGERLEERDGQVEVFVVGGKRLLRLVGISGVSAGSVVGKGFGRYQSIEKKKKRVSKTVGPRART